MESKSLVPSGALFDCIYSFWYNAQTQLPAGATVEMERQKGLLRMGEFVARNM